MKKLARRFLQAIAVMLSIAVLASLALFIHLTTPVTHEAFWKEVEIPEGASYTKGLAILQENDIISSKFGLLLVGKISETDTALKPGFYSLSASMTPMEIYDDLIMGRTIQFTVTIPEGSSLKRIKKKLVKKGLLSDEDWELAYDEDFLDFLEIDAPSLEGYIYPDTYKFPKGIDPDLLFKIMVQRLREIYDEPLRARAEEIKFTENEVLTLASIIEREAQIDSERPLISAVYHNRLKKNMRLQADPTVLYGIKKRPKRIRYRDLRRVTPYNTYKIKGLPPGPISSPGIKSIMAALYPADVDYLYFVSMNNGTHYFSSTGKEHVKAVAEYQKKRKKKVR